MARTLKGILINVKESDAAVVEIENTLGNLHQLIGCKCIDIVCRQIGGRAYEIVCDDNGMFAENRTISAVGHNQELMFVGNLFVVGLTTRNGDLKSLTKTDIENIQAHVRQAIWDDGKITPMLVGVTY